MRQSTSPLWRVNLSPKAEKTLDAWLKAKKYGLFFDGEFTPMPQLSVGVMVELLDDVSDIRASDETLKELVWDAEEDLIDFLERKVGDILEEKD